MMTDTGKSGLALLLTVSGSRPGYISIGSGSGLVAVTNTALVSDLNIRRAFTETELGVSKQVTFTSDWGAVTMSGVLLKEFGVTTGSSGGTVWNRECFNTITFDGTNELQVSVTFRIF